MPIDPSIALSYRFPQFQSPGEQQREALTLAGLIDQQRQRQMQMQKAQAYEAAMRGLPVGATDEQRLEALRPFQSADQQGSQITASRDRKVLREQQALQFMSQMDENASARILKHEEFQQRAADQRMKDAETMQYKQDMLNLQKQNASSLNYFKQQGIDLRRDQMAQGNRPPAGYRWSPQGDLERIPGGPADEKAGVAGQKAEMRDRGAMIRANIVINKVDEALAKTGFFTTGLTGDIRSTLVGRITGSGAYDLEKTIDTIKANVGFKELQDMLESSPTGGALGQIAVRELDFLQAAVASLEKGQSQDLVRKNLKQVKTHFENWKKAVQQAAAQAPKTAPSDSEWKDL